MFKNITLLILGLLVFQISKAQTSTKDTVNQYYVTVNGQKVRAFVEMEPEFRNGGIMGFRNFLAQNVVIPDSAKQRKVVGKVIANFVVEKDGSLNEIKIIESPDASLANAVVDAIKLSPAWRPGKQNGQPVREHFQIALAFDLSK